jgi:hypothetical protein
MLHGMVAACANEGTAFVLENGAVYAFRSRFCLLLYRVAEDMLRK